MVTASAPGKVHLIGEHAVVYNEPAIIAAVGLRTTVEAEKTEKCRYIDTRWDVDTGWFSPDEIFAITKETEELWQKCFEKKNFTELFQFIKADRYINYRKAMLGLALKHLGIEHGVTVKIKSEIPVGAGLGSSSSLAVALTKAIAELFGKNATNEEINEIAYEQEEIIHGTPSGGDNSACCFGGLIWFRKTVPKNEIKPLKKEIPYKLENFVLVYTGEPNKTTGELVQMVRDLDEDYRNKRVQEIGKMTHEMLEVLKKKDFTRMKELINQTQKNLAELGVSTPDIDKIAKAVCEIGGAAKLCGAGGGGIMLCWHENKEKLINTIKSLGFEPIETELGVEGVRIEA